MYNLKYTIIIYTPNFYQHIVRFSIQVVDPIDFNFDIDSIPIMQAECWPSSNCKISHVCQAINHKFTCAQLNIITENYLFKIRR